MVLAEMHGMSVSAADVVLNDGRISTALISSVPLAQGGGGGGLGITFGTHNPYGPVYSPHEDVGGSIWR
jgi:hypothetical protein